MGELSGCSARAPIVMTLVCAAKLYDKSRNKTACNYAEAMIIKELQQLMQWSERVCPNQWIEGGEGEAANHYHTIAPLLAHPVPSLFSLSVHPLDMVTFYTSCWSHPSLMMDPMQLF